MDIDARRARHSRLSSALARMNDEDLAFVVDDGSSDRGWGRTRTVDIDGSPVFVKSIPVTQREVDHRFSTRNLHRLPTYYSYGVGSAGFGVYRELAAHVKTTDWVLSGAIETFPLMYHHRLMRRRPAGRFEGEPLDAYVRSWNGSRRIGRYMTERSEALRAEVIFLEHIPFMMGDWLRGNLAHADGIVASLFRTVGFLRGQGIVHFDAHFGNVVTDSTTPYLTDFGLLLDREFELTEPERRFLDRHSHYDYGVVLWSIGAQLLWAYQALDDASRTHVDNALGIDAAAPTHVKSGALVRNVETVQHDEAFALDDLYVASVLRHRPAILYMNEFFRRMRAGTRKDARYDDARMRELLRGCGAL